MLAVAILLAINAAFALIAGVSFMVSECHANCLFPLFFNISWGAVGLLSAGFLFAKHIWALWGACVLLGLQSIGLQTKEFFYDPMFGLSFSITIGDDASLVAFNLAAIAAICVLVTAYIRNYQDTDTAKDIAKQEQN